MANEITLEVPSELDGARVDKVLATMLGVSRAQARDLIDDGVSIDGAPARPADRVTEGSSITTPTPEEVVGLEAEEVEFEVLYEDDTVVVVDKPVGVVVHPGAGRSRGTLAAGLLYRYPEIEGVGSVDRWGLVHRLDKDTSGTLVVARTVLGYENLVGQLKRREITRVYICLVQGRFDAPTGTIEAPIGRDPNRPMRRAVVQGGKSATTHYEVDREYPEFGCSLLTVRLETGRTHQIRVHFLAVDHPVIGDKIYGAKTPKVISPRIFLHASRVEFGHPTTGERVSVDSPLPPDLRAVLDSLDQHGTG
ncbi:MAG: RluA family pseudouridine synthase [Acidimicrobiia bacterium]